MMSLNEVYEIARKDLDLYEEEYDALTIKIVFIWKPSDGLNYEWIYDDEYSFEGTQEDYENWKNDYFEFYDIDENYISYRPKNVSIAGHPDVSILYFREC